MTEQQALEYLTDLLAFKKLKIITAFENKDHDSRTTRIRPSFFIQHDVIRMDVKDGFVKAYSEEGDTCRGIPSAVLSRLTEWEREPKLDAVGI